MIFFILLNSLLISSVFSSEKTWLDFPTGKVKVEKIFEGEDIIWGFDFLSKTSTDQIIFTEREGKLKWIDLKTKKVSEVKGVPAVYASSQGGLLDVLVDENSIYLTYSELDKLGATTSVYKGELNPEKNMINGKRFFQAQAFENGGIHFGSRIVKDKKSGFFFLSVGDRNKREKAQELSLHNGKILRLSPSGVGEVWSQGHRNPQGLAFNSKGELFNSEFGPKGGDEINQIGKNNNYGWPIVTYGKEYWGPKIGVTDKVGFIQPLIHWVPSINPSGMTFYEESRFKELKGKLLIATLGGLHLNIVDFGSNPPKSSQWLESLEERMRQVKVGPDGLIYISTDSGKILRLVPQ